MKYIKTVNYNIKQNYSKASFQKSKIDENLTKIQTSTVLHCTSEKSYKISKLEHVGRKQSARKIDHDPSVFFKLN